MEREGKKGLDPVTVSATANLLLENLDTVALNFIINPGEAGGINAAQPAGEKWIMVVLDKSGSMSGSAITQAKEAIIQLVRAVKGDANTNSFFSLMSFQSVATAHTLADQQQKTIENEVNKITAGGGTSFSNIFDALTKSLTEYTTKRDKSKHEFSEIVMIFFTDGQDQSDTGRRKASMIALKNSLEAIGNSSVHTIGFSADHDARLLSEITTAGTSQGTFQYVNESKAIPIAMTSITQLILQNQNSISAKLRISNLGNNIPDREEKIYLSKLSNGRFSANHFMRSAEFASAKLKLFVHSSQSGNFEFNVMPEIKKEIDLPDMVHFITDLVTSEVVQLSRTTFAEHADKSLLPLAHARAKQFDAAMIQLSEIALKSRSRQERKDMMAAIQAAEPLLAEFHRALSSAMAGALTNDKIAALNALAYKNITKQGLAKKLDERVEANAAMFRELEQRIKKNVAAIDFAKLRLEHGEGAESFGQCALSCQNWIDALQDHDCFCITLNVGRSEAAIADPTQVIIKDIGSTFVTAESFLDAVQFSVKKNESAHGGFDKWADSSIVLGNAREPISGVLPLYINDHHWSVARHKMKPILGWMATLDVMGYTFAQVKTIPFLVLAFCAAHAHESAYKRHLFELVSATCLQIYKDASRADLDPSITKLSTEVKELWNKFFVDPAVRTVDSIANNAIFLAQLYCAQKCGDIEPMNAKQLEALFSLLAEEELRRRQPFSLRQLSEADLHQLMTKLLNLSVLEPVFINPVVEHFKKEQTAANESKLQRMKNFFDGKMALVLSGAPVAWMEGREQIADCTVVNIQVPDEIKRLASVLDVEPEKKIDGSIPGQPSDELKKMISDNEKLFEVQIVPLMQMERLWNEHGPGSGSGGECVRSNLRQIGCESIEQHTALLLQNICQAQNSDRRQAIASKCYWNPLVCPRDVLKHFFLQLILKEKSAKMRLILNDLLAQNLALVASYENQYKNFKSLNELAWEQECQRQCEWERAHPLPRLYDYPPTCLFCHHMKPNYAGFRCVCGCMECYTSKYFAPAKP